MVYLRIKDYEKLENVTYWDRVKIAVWNFLLPPHIKFEIREDNKGGRNARI